MITASQARAIALDHSTQVESELNNTILTSIESSAKLGKFRVDVIISNSVDYQIVNRVVQRFTDSGYSVAIPENNFLVIKW